MRSAAVTNALIAKLLAGSALMALTPDGVFFQVAGASMATAGAKASRFVIVSLVLGTNTQLFNRRGFLDAVYLVEARVLSTSVAHPRTVALDAAAAIDTLLDPQPPLTPATLTIPGFRLMALHQEEPTEDTEFDDVDPSIVWHRAGGHYHLWAEPIAT